MGEAGHTIRVSRDAFERFVRDCLNPPSPSAKLRAILAAQRDRKGLRPLPLKDEP